MFWGRLLHPQPEEAPCRGDRAPHNARRNLKIGHGRFLPHLFRFVIHTHPTIRRYITKTSLNEVRIIYLYKTSIQTLWRTAKNWNLLPTHCKVLFLEFVAHTEPWWSSLGAKWCSEWRPPTSPHRASDTDLVRTVQRGTPTWWIVTSLCVGVDREN
jgi:hypothetical protein